MAIAVRDVVAAMEDIAPPRLACKKDPIGLHAGDLRWRVRRLLLCLDVTPAAVRQAQRQRCDMIIAHHPLFYHPLPNLAETSPRGWLAAEIARSRLAVYCAHTNLDNAAGGINDTLAELAGLAATAPLTVEARDRFLKLAIFVPESHVEVVRQAICDAGAGRIGEYTDCSFRTRGIGTFRGSAASQPYIGKAEAKEEVEEWRIETLLCESQRPAVEAALRSAHPYEEPAYDFYPLADSRGYGLGRVGELAKAATLRSLAMRMKKSCAAARAMVRGDPRHRTKRIGVLGGGPFAAEKLLAHRLDALVIGEIAPSEADFLWQHGCGVIVLGHAASEEVVFPRLRRALQRALPGLEVLCKRPKESTTWEV